MRRLKDAPRLRRGATCAGAAVFGRFRRVRLFVRGGGLDRRLAREGEQSGGGLECIDLSGGRPGCRAELRNERLGRQRLERLGGRLGGLVDDGLEKFEGLGGHQHGVEHRRGLGTRCRRDERSCGRRLGDDRLLARLTRPAAATRDEGCLCGGCGERRHDGRERLHVSERGDRRALSGVAATGAASVVGVWTGAGRPQTIAGRSGAAPAVRRRRSAREAPVVSAVAEGGVADERLERRVGADAASGASKGKAQGAFGIVVARGATVRTSGY